MYKQIKEIEITMSKLIEKHKELNLNYEKKKHQDFCQTLCKLSRRDLIIIKTIVDIGLSGRGFIHDSGNDNKKIFEIEIKEKSEVLLKRFSGFVAYNDHELLVERLSQEAEFSYGLLSGLELLKELGNKENRIQETLKNWPIVKNIDEYKYEEGKIVTMIQTGIQENTYIYFWVSNEVIGRIEELREKFINWIQNVEGIYPYRQYVRQLMDGKVLYEGYTYRYSCYEFIDWINTYVYENYVAKRTSILNDFMTDIKIEF